MSISVRKESKEARVKRSKRKIVVIGGSGVAGVHLVEALRRAAGVDALSVSRHSGVDVTTGVGLDKFLSGVQRVVDVSSTESPDEGISRTFFVASAKHLQRAAERAGVERLFVLSIVGVDQLSHGYAAAKFEQERTIRSGAVPAFVVRSTQFYELVQRIRNWGLRDGIWWVQDQLVQPVAVAAVVSVLAELVLTESPPAAISEVAGPQREQLVDMARRWAARRGERVEVRGIPDDSPDGRAFKSGALLPGHGATITGPTFQQWLDEGERGP